ncbi:MAG: hypothetical protein WCO60_07155 [Verrucomicrobiota bacterium]
MKPFITPFLLWGSIKAVLLFVMVFISLGPVACAGKPFTPVEVVLLGPYPEEALFRHWPTELDVPRITAAPNHVQGRFRQPLQQMWLAFIT